MIDELAIRNVGLMCLMLWLAGCASAAHDIAEAASPPAAISALGAVGDPRNQQIVANAAESPGVTHASRRLGNAIGEGIVDQLFAQLGIPSSLATTQPTTQKFSGEVSEMIRHQLELVMDTLLGPHAQRQAADMAAAVSEGSMRGFTRGLHDQLAPELSRAIQEQIGPAIAKSVRDQVGPAIGDSVQLHLTANLRRAADEAAHGLFDAAGSQAANQSVRELSKQATVGIQEGVTSTGKPAPLEQMSLAIVRMTWIIIGLLVVAGVQATAFFGFLWVLYRQKKS